MLEHGFLTRSRPLLIAPLKSSLSSCPFPESLLVHKNGVFTIRFVERTSPVYPHRVLGLGEVAACGGGSSKAEGRLKEHVLPIHANRRAAVADTCNILRARHLLRIISLP